MSKTLPYPLLLLLFIFSCQNEKPGALFTKVSKNKTGINFRNLLKEDENFNIFKYQYFNNGGGLAVGDFNNDGLQDLVFTGNMVKNRLYLNRGGFKFEDITQQSGIAEKEGWCTGVSTADINGDGWLDLYICRAGYPFDDLRSNLLFINNGDLTFTEKAAEYGLDDLAYSTHSAFFDYDLDGDLDLFLLNHSTVEYSRGSLEVFQLRNKKDPAFTNKLFRNDGGHFTNVTDEAGIYSNVLTFSLGLSIADINGDGWPDIFIGNDFNEPDYLFVNQGNGTFVDRFAEAFDHTSMFSMGADVADFNNDGLPDLVSLDMLPESNFLQKMHSGADNYDKVAMLEKNGFFKQYSRNMLQLNNGDGTFSEMGQMAGISNTDWSWTPLFFDFDNDGLKDLFIANGYPRDHTDMDFLTFTANEVMQIERGKDPIDFEGYMAQMPPILLPNYFYKNNGNGRFANMAAEWGLDEPLISQSAAYVDLDNDGDLDLVTNNTADFAAVYENHSDELTDHHFLKIELAGAKGNPSGIGAKLSLYAGGKMFYQEQQPVRGFQSSVDPVLNFGLGNIAKLDSLAVVWPRGERQVLRGVAADQKLELDIKNASKKTHTQAALTSAYFHKKNILDARHRESNFNDLNVQSLLPWFLSRQGPAMAIGDVDGDGREDVFLGNAKGTAGQLFLQNADGRFAELSSPVFEKDAGSEDAAAAFFDADGDGDLDLFVASGSYEFPENDPALQDRIYLNDGTGNFAEAKKILPGAATNSTCAVPADVDGDGDMDLFVGGGYIYGKYPKSYENQLLINNGKGVFEKRPLGTGQAGNVTDALWADLDGDQLPELITAGEWQPIRVFGNENGALTDRTEQYFDQPMNGMWNALHAADFDGDGDVDLVAGNLGTNSQLSAKPDEPLELFYGDFDENGSVDPLLCYYVQGRSWPLASRDDLIGQLPYLKKKFLFFKEYANAQIQDILTPDQLQSNQKLQAVTLETTYFENAGGKFVKRPLPVLAQVAPVHAIQSLDVNGDGFLDLVLAGNTLQARVKLGRLDGNHGLVLLGDGKGQFRLATAAETGLKMRGAVRQIERVRVAGKPHILVGINDGEVKVFQAGE